MLSKLSESIWALALPLLLGTGVWLTLRSKGFALRRTGQALRQTLSPHSSGPGTVSPFSCLCTALASTVGTGNIAGVAFALTAGGPGALVWMWISAALGCAVKYAECALAVLHREGGATPLGGPMVTLSKLRPKKLGKLLGTLYAAVMVFATLSANNLVQSSAVSDALRHLVPMPHLAVGILMGGLLLFILSGGSDSVARVSSGLVPVMLALYLLGGGAVLLRHIGQIPKAFEMLFCEAFSLRSFGAGSFGNMVRIGVTRGCFSNDSGTGSAAFSAALTSASPVEQGLISATANLWDTGVICSVTGLSILVSVGLDSGLTGAPLVMAAYRTGLGAPGGWIVGICLILFAFSSLPGLAFQGEQALRYLCKGKSLVKLYRLGFSAVACWGCLVSTQTALSAADCCNAMLVMLNLPSLWLLEIPIDKGK